MSIVIMPCYILLEVIREYAVEQLQVMGDEDLYQRSHAGYYAELAEEAERVGPGQGRREAHLDQESGIGRAAGYVVWTVLDETRSDERLISCEQFRQPVHVELHF